MAEEEPENDDNATGVHKTKDRQVQEVLPGRRRKRTIKSYGVMMMMYLLKTQLMLPVWQLAWAQLVHAIFEIVVQCPSRT